MPIHTHFSKSSFIEENERDPSSRSFANALEVEIQHELHQVLLPKIQEIVGRLNAIGHQLKEYTPSMPGDISFRDDENMNGGYKCFLRLGVDTVVSVGFKDAVCENGDCAPADHT